MTPISIVFSLLLQSTAPAAIPPAQVAQAQPVKAKNDDPNKMVCKRRLKTGSLADYEKVCLTKSDWQRFSDSQRDAWGEIQGAKGSTHGG